MNLLMTPGPGPVAQHVLDIRSLPRTNPDLDQTFFDYYKELTESISSLLHTHNQTLILCGEGILGLEAACASLTEPNDRVLVLDNGVYGKGFADFVSLYDGDPVLYSTSYDEPIAVDALRDFLEKDHNFKYATLVHCDTPSGMLNDISQLCPLLKEYGILTVVDSVSSMFGMEIKVDDFGIDILCGGSQKVISAPAGLTLVTISHAAYEKMRSRNTKIHSFYANLLAFDNWYENKLFPYTMPIHDIYGLGAAIQNIHQDSSIYERHEIIGNYVRTTLQNAGLELHPNHGFSNTVTAIKIPKGFTDIEILEKMQTDYQIMIGSSFGDFKGQLIRIGHMGESAQPVLVEQTLKALLSILDLPFTPMIH